MKKNYSYKTLVLFIFTFICLFNMNFAYSQCNTSIVSTRDSIACGQSVFLQQVGVGGVSSDDFSAGTLSGLWQSVSAGYTIGGPCGVNPNGGVHLWFGNGCPIPRTATTVPVDASCGGNICFDFRQETQGGACDGPDLTNEGVYLQYRTAVGPWTTINYFNPIGFPFTGWQNHCFPIPAPAQTTTTQFRWQQTNASGTTWDFWGIDNVNIGTCSGYSTLWSGGNINGYTLDSITVSPDITTTYNLMYSNWIDDTCYATKTIVVDQPTIVSSIILSACSGSDTLDAQATITANCTYTLELFNYLPGGTSQPGWSAGGSPVQYHNLDIYLNGPLYSNYTMTTGGNFASVTYSVPVTDGDQLDAIFTNMGTAASECMYRIYDSQGFGAGFTPITQQGFPGSAPGNFSTTVSCPATANYNYSWSNITNGGSVGLSNPNVQNPLATVATITQFEVTAYDSLNPQCIAIDTVTVSPTANNISATVSANTVICDGDAVILNFALVGSPPYDIDMTITDVNGSTSATFQIDQLGLQTNGNGAITFFPNQNTTYSIISLSDATGCPASVINPTISVLVNSIPNSGTSSSVNFCTSEPINDLSNYLGIADNFGYWTPPSGSPISNGLNYNFDPQNDIAGIYTYTVDNAPCPISYSTIIVNLISSPYPGSSTTINENYCQNSSIVDLANLLTTPATNGTWSGVFGSVIPPVGTASFSFNPLSDPSGTYTYTVSDPSGTCPDASADINIIINAVPSVAISSINSNICIGSSTCLDFALTGSSNFNIDISDGSLVSSIVLDASGNQISGGCYSVSPTTTTTYTVTTISDNNNCQFSPSSASVIINVTPLPNAGISPLLPLDICSDDLSMYPLENELGGLQDLTGYWSVPNVLPNNSSFIFNPQTMTSGVYTYTVIAAPCPSAIESVTVNLITAANAGIANNQEICINDYSSSLYNLNNLIIGGDIGGTWCTGPVSGGTAILSNIDPNLYGVGSHQFTYQVLGITPCANDETSITLIIHPKPEVGSFTSNVPTIPQGNPISLTVNMIAGTPPFTINLSDNDLPPNLYNIAINPPNMTGSASAIPNIIPNTNYSIINIIDGNGCTSDTALNVSVSVDPYPTIDPFSATDNNICYGTIPSVNMTLSQGVAPVTVNYQYNGTGTIYSEVIGIAGQIGPIPVVNIALDTSNLNIGANIITILSVIDINGVASLNIPNPITITVQPNPIITFSTSTSEICFEESAILDFGFLVGSAPFDIEYTINNLAQTPLSFSTGGTQAYNLNPDPAVGNNTYEIIKITDAFGCESVPSTTMSANILVNQNPLVGISISGSNPICIGQSSSLYFPIITAGAPPYNVSFMTGSSLSTVSIDASGFISATGTTKPIFPNNTTQYTLVSVIDNKACQSSLSDSTKLIVNELPILDFSGTTEMCEQDITQLYFNFQAGSSPWTVYYNINNGPSNFANFNNNIDSISISPISTAVYTIDSISDLNCSAILIDQATITINPLPEVNLSGGGSVCNDGSEVDVIISTSSGTPAFDVEYSVGINSRLASNIGYQHIISTNEAGIYTIIKAVDSKGCIAQNITGNATINVNPVPDAKITAFPLFANMINPKINFIDESDSHINGIWDFGDGNTQLTNFGEIKHTYEDTGTYLVSLEIMSDSGCMVTAYETIIIDQVFNIYIPTAFTPNNDLYNDYFLPIANGIQEYDLTIYDRFGKQVFNTDKTNIAWDGKINNGIEYATTGNYIYNIILIDFKGKERKFQGKLLLIR